jgi:hypothetical protein
MAKTKKPRSAKQLANDERLRNLAKNPIAPPTAPTLPPEDVEDEDFVPTEVAERKAAEAAGGLKEPTVDPNAEVVDDVPEAPAGPQMPLTPQIDPNLIATIVATVQAMQTANPQIAKATPDEKADQTAAAMGVRGDQSKAVLGKNGVQGISYRYDIEKSHYPDPTKRLLAEPKLANFAMEYNYKFRWSVDGEQFEKHGMTFAEPRFTLELFRVLRDDENEPTGRMALVARAMQHEDDFVVRMAADQLGLLDQFEDTEEGFRMLRDEVRYWRLQQWLLAIFKPAKINTFRRAPRTEVIAGKAVEVYDTEQLTDHDTGVAKASTLKSESGIGGIATPGN